MISRKKAAREEFKTLTYPHMKLLYNMALKYCGNSYDAQDIVQETYLMAFNKFHQLRDRSKCRPWLLRILRNNFLKSFQKNKIRQKIAETDYVDFLKESLTSGSAETLLLARADILNRSRELHGFAFSLREAAAGKVRAKSRRARDFIDELQV